MGHITRSIGAFTFSYRGLLVITAAFAGSAACGTDGVPTESVQREESAQVLDAGVISTWNWTDETGTIHVQVRNCDFGANGQSVVAECAVHPDYVLVGGGAAIDPAGDPGALLTANYPDPQSGTWKAASKAHHVPFLHRLRASSIALRLSGVTQQMLKFQTHYVGQLSGPSAAPSATATVIPGDILVGGGGRAIYNGAGLLLTESQATDSVSWRVSAKAHHVYDTGTASVFAIGVKRCPTGYTGGCLSSSIFTSSGSHGTGFRVTQVLVPGPWLPTSLGGRAASDNFVAGRLLNAITPARTGPSPLYAFVSTKDHVIAESGYAIAQALGVRREAP